MYTEMSLKEALEYFMKGRKVLVLNEYDDKSISVDRIEDCLPKEAKYLVDVPATANTEFEHEVLDTAEPNRSKYKREVLGLREDEGVVAAEDDGVVAEVDECCIRSERRHRR